MRNSVKCHLNDATTCDQVGSDVVSVPISSKTQCRFFMDRSSVDFCIPFFDELFHDRDVATPGCMM